MALKLPLTASILGKYMFPVLVQSQIKIDPVDNCHRLCVSTNNDAYLSSSRCRLRSKESTDKDDGRLDSIVNL